MIGCEIMSRKDNWKTDDEEILNMTTDELLVNVDIGVEVVRETMMELLKEYSDDKQIVNEVKEYERKMELLELEIASLKAEWKRKSENK